MGIMLETILQTRIPADMYQTVTALANANGLSVAAWLRRLVFKEVSRMRMEAWVYHKSERVNRNVLASYLLEPLNGLASTNLECRLLDGSTGAPITDIDMQRISWGNEPTDYRFYLALESRPWKIFRLMCDRHSRGVIVVLQTDQA